MTKRKHTKFIAVIVPDTYDLGEKYTEGDRTFIDMTIYTGETFKLRVVQSNENEDLIIAGDSLFNRIHPGEWGSENDGYDPMNPKAAEAVDDAIFFYTDSLTLLYTDEKLTEEMANENPCWFN